MMLRRLNKIKSLLSDAQQTALFEYFKSLRRKAVPTKNVVLVQCVEDLYYFGLFGQIVTSLRERQSIRVEQYVVRCLNVGESKSILTFLKARWIVNPLLNIVWERLFSSFCDSVAFRSTTLFPIWDTVDFYRAWKIWQGLTDKNSLINLQLDGVIAGDLINDSYLRYKPAPAVDLKDNYLLILLWQSLRYARRSRAYFSRVSPKLFLTSYSTYIHHGIPVRIALQYGVRVFSFGNYQEFAKELSITDWVHTKNPDNYAADFFKLVNQDNKLTLAENALSTRLLGGVDNATAYMKKSAYAEIGERVPDVNGAVVVFLHDFYDSPHVYREMLFPDFWDWICFTIDTLTAANIPFFVKPHPNQIHLSGEVLDDLKKCYPDLSMISTGVTNKQLAEAGMICAVTVYGTVAHEMAYLGVPTIACARHPHINFEFCRTAFSKDEYASLLLDSKLSGLDREVMRCQSLIFYYMHNLALPQEILLLRVALANFRSVCVNPDEQSDLAGMIYEISVLGGFQKEISRMLKSE